MAAICLAGLSRLLISHGGTNGAAVSQDLMADGIDERSFLDRTLMLIGRGGLFFAVAGPVLAVVGYTRAAVFFTLSPALSLGLLAMVSFLQRLSMHLFRLFAPQGKDPAQGLLPVLINFALLTAALPIFAG